MTIYIIKILEVFRLVDIHRSERIDSWVHREGQPVHAHNNFVAPFLQLLKVITIRHSNNYCFWTLGTSGRYIRNWTSSKEGDQELDYYRTRIKNSFTVRDRKGRRRKINTEVLEQKSGLWCFRMIDCSRFDHGANTCTFHPEKRSRNWSRNSGIHTPLISRDTSKAFSNGRSLHFLLIKTKFSMKEKTTIRLHEDVHFRST